MQSIANRDLDSPAERVGGCAEFRRRLDVDGQGGPGRALDDLGPVFDHLGKAAHHRLDRTRINVVPLHVDHVVRPAQDAADHPHEPSPARATLVGESDPIAGAVAQQRRPPPSQIGQHEFTFLARLEQPLAVRLDDLDDPLVLVEMHAAGVSPALEPGRTDLGHARMIKNFRAPTPLESFPRGRYTASGFARDDQCAHRHAGQIDALNPGDFRQPQRVGRRGQHHGDFIVPHEPEPGRAGHRPAGHGQHPAVHRALERAPKPDEWSERRRDEQSIRPRHARRRVDRLPTRHPPDPVVRGIQAAERFAGRARRLVQTHVPFDFVGQTRPVRRMCVLIVGQFGFGREAKSPQVRQAVLLIGGQARLGKLARIERVARQDRGQHPPKFTVLFGRQRGAIRKPLSQNDTLDVA